MDLWPIIFEMATSGLQIHGVKHRKSQTRARDWMPRNPILKGGLDSYGFFHPNNWSCLVRRHISYHFMIGTHIPPCIFHRSASDCLYHKAIVSGFLYFCISLGLNFPIEIRPYKP